MPVQTPDGFNPKKDSLIVCAGTVTCDTVADMGAGFSAFKKYFNKNIHHEEQPGGWQTALQGILDNYHQKNNEMPAYVRIAKQDSYIGGIATVPVYYGGKGLNFTHFSDKTEEQINLKEQYQTAVKQAVLDAKALKRPLLLQPLGIGVYGWAPEIAASLFAKAIAEADPDDEVDITIPIFNSTPGSSDDRFRTTLHTEMQKGKNAAPNPAKSEKPASPNKGAVPTISKPAEPAPQKDKATPSASEPGRKIPDNKQILIGILNTLINNIEMKKGSRWSSGKDSEKVKSLMDIKRSITHETKEVIQGSPVQTEYLQKIMGICQIKRNPIHFWKTPDSVKEFEQLLAEKNIKLPAEPDVSKHKVK